ncbi:hypothetical protein KKG41_06560 [Patescibacteria group bacterium]|nr:hypothetical protein [Patescibacteria group bacterium]MBU1890682.1 hypothetical protein [Patescibacteria group bacterium]
MARVFVFDPNPDRHMEYLGLLKGNDVVVSMDSNTALEEIRETNPDLILVDSEAEDSQRLIMQIRRDLGMEFIVIYLLGRASETNDLARCLQTASNCCANGYIPRPIYPVIMQELVRAAQQLSVYGHTEGVTPDERTALTTETEDNGLIDPPHHIERDGFKPPIIGGWGLSFN